MQLLRRVSKPCSWLAQALGGLSAAAALAKKGLRVTVLEAQSKPGGCASTFAHDGYLFDVAATLPCGFSPGGPMDLVAEAAGIRSWPVRATDRVMSVHLADGGGFDLDSYPEIKKWIGRVQDQPRHIRITDRKPG